MTSRSKRQVAGRRAVLKSKVFERTIVKMFRDAGFTAQRNFDQAGKHSRSQEKLPDVSVAELPELWIECSTGAQVSPRRKLAQAESDLASVPRLGILLIPVAVTRKKASKEILATMYLEDFVDFLRSRVKANAAELLRAMSMKIDGTFSVSMDFKEFLRICK